MSLRHVLGCCGRRLLTLGLCLGFTSLLYAQKTLSFDFGYGNRGYSYSEKGLDAFDSSLPEGQYVHFSPRIGFELGEGVMAGVKLGVSYSSYNYAEGYYDAENAGWQELASTTSSVLSLSGGAFLRMRVAEVGKLAFHIEVAGLYRYGWGKDYRTEYKVSFFREKVDMSRKSVEQEVTLSVVPVVSYELTKHIGVDFYLGFASLYWIGTTIERWPYFTTSGYFGNNPPTVSDEPDSKTTTQRFDAGLSGQSGSLLSVGFNYVF